MIILFASEAEQAGVNNDDYFRIVENLDNTIEDILNNGSDDDKKTEFAEKLDKLEEVRFEEGSIVNVEFKVGKKSRSAEYFFLKLLHDEEFQNQIKSNFDISCESVSIVRPEEDTVYTTTKDIEPDDEEVGEYHE
jgi:hypothetical protein